MDEILPLPTICVDLDSLYDGSCDRRIIPGYEETNHSADELSLVVRLDKEICPVLSADSPSGTLPRPLDLQQVDFLGSIDVVKKLFSMPYTDQRPLFTLHRMGNTLLLDNVTCHDTNPYDINFSADDKSHKYRENNDGRSANPSAVTVAGGRMQPLQYADFTFNSLDHLITSTNIESLLGKVTPLYLPAPSKPQSEPYRGLLMNEEVCERQTSAYSRQDRQDACRLNGIQESYSPLRVDNTTISENPAVSPKKNDLSAEGTQAELGSTKEGGASSHSKTPVTDEYKRGVSIASGSPFLPPPNYFMPSAPPPARWGTYIYLLRTFFIVECITIHQSIYPFSSPYVIFFLSFFYSHFLLSLSIFSFFLCLSLSLSLSASHSLSHYLALSLLSVRHSLLYSLCSDDSSSTHFTILLSDICQTSTVMGFTRDEAGPKQRSNYLPHRPASCFHGEVS